MKVGICFKSSSEMSDRLFEGITTYRKCQIFQFLDFNKLNILFGKEQNVQNIDIDPFISSVKLFPGQMGFWSPFPLVNAPVPRKDCCTLETCDLVFSLSDLQRYPDKLQAEYTQRKISIQLS